MLSRFLLPLAALAIMLMPGAAHAAAVSAVASADKTVLIRGTDAAHAARRDFTMRTFTLTVATADTVTIPTGAAGCEFNCMVLVTPSTATTEVASLSSGAYLGQVFEFHVLNANTFVIPSTLSNVDFGFGGNLVITEAHSGAIRWDGTDWRLASASTTDMAPKVRWRTDFLGDLYAGELLAGVGSGTGNAVALSPGRSGRLEIKTSSADAADSANASSIGLGALDWRADQGGLAMEARIQFDAITAVGAFIGFTDTIPSTVEMPIFMVAADIDSTATDAAGLLFDTDATTDQWTCGGVKADVDTAPVLSGTAPSATTYYTVRVEISAAGAVTCYVDGVAVGAATANAITATTPVLPIIVANNRSAVVRNVLVDYITAEATR